MPCIRLAVCALLVLAITSFVLPAHGEWAVEEVVDVAPVWSGHPVRFCLLTHGDRQFVAYYDAQRRMTVVSRDLDSLCWTTFRLPSKSDEPARCGATYSSTILGWDSHNSITMAVGPAGDLHLSGNLHCNPLLYFRTIRPGDVTSLVQIDHMVGANEQRSTYPKFLPGAEGELIFTYRDGGSGNGNQIFNVYDPKSKRWRRLLDSPLFDGQGKMNAYFQGPLQDADGVFHVCWVWRDTPDCATNHHLSYARSRDMVHWETSAGEPIALPITIDTAEVVDPVPPGGGMLNGNTKLGFDTQGRVIVSYHKFDADGKTQLYNARREADGWKIYQTSDWDYRWEFGGGGSIRSEVRIGPVVVAADGTLTQDYRHVRYGSGNWRLDEATLRPLGQAPPTDHLPREIGRLRSKHPGMGVRTAGDLGHSETPGQKYILRWETLPRNRDRAQTGPLPEPSLLQVYRIGKVE